MKPRANIRQRQLSLGIFVKTDSPQITEVLGTTDLDFVVVDAEHAPFDRLTLDRHMMAGRATGIPVIVRIPDTSAATIQSVLDLGAAGLLVPRVDNAEQAREVVARARYRNGSRGSWRRLKTDRSNTRGVWSTTTSASTSRQYRVRWTAPDGTTFTGPPTRSYRAP